MLEFDHYLGFKYLQKLLNLQINPKVETQMMSQKSLTLYHFNKKKITSIFFFHPKTHF